MRRYIMRAGVYANIKRGGFTTIPLVLGVGAIVIVIGALIIVISTSSIYNVNLSIKSYQANGLVNACLEEALLRLQQNNSFLGQGTTNIGANSCSYDISTINASTRLINASSTIAGVSRKGRIQVLTPNPLKITQWQEVAD